MEEKLTISVPRGVRERRQCLAVLLDQPGLAAGELDARVEMLIRHADRRGLSLEHCVFVERQGRIRSACLTVDAPGRMASVFIPNSPERLRPASIMQSLLARAVEEARQRGVQVMQACILPDSGQEAAIYRRAGFRRLAQLVYMERDLAEPVPSQAGPRDVRFEGYDRAGYEVFAEVVQGTYEGSLDCVDLNAVRDIADILASHRGTGPFRAELWRLARVGTTPIGVVLLSAQPDRWAWEVAYLGLLPAWRGRGYGRALLAHAMELCRTEAVPVLMLSVDADNTPALALYQRFGFRETFRRDVWMKNFSV